MIKKILIEPTDNTLIQFFRYFLVGGSAFIVDFTVLYLLTSQFKIYYLLSAAISFTLGLVFNYLLSVAWVFNRSTLHNKLAEFTIFAVIGLAGLIFNELFIWLFTEQVHFHYLFSKVLTAVLVFIWNFFARKIILFKR